MRMNNQNYIVTIILLCLTLYGMKYAHVPQNAAKTGIALDSFPVKTAGWTGKDIPVSARSLELLKPDGLLFREYTSSSGEKVELVIIAGLNKRESFHPPEVCYSGDGSSIESKTLHRFSVADKETLEVNRLSVTHKKDNHTQAVFFWFTAGKQNYANYYRQQSAIVWEEFKSRQSWGSLVRVSVLRRAQGSRTDDKILEDFVRDIYHLLPAYTGKEG